MKVHVFGNTSSPVVPTVCLWKTAELGEEEFGSDARAFMHNNFYVDCGLKSVTNSAEAVDHTRGMLASYNLRLHKIVSNDLNVTQVFPREDRASDPHDWDFSQDTIPIQRTLGVLWDVSNDAFTF